MSDRKAVNKYYPPDWTPEQGSINKYVGQHPLRDRARKLDQGILIIRFEIPYNIWCLGCGKMIGTGTRYNAEKKKVGNYFSTPILSFRMKCHLCPNWIEMRTDPKNTAYVVTEGAKQKNETWDPREVGAHHIQDASDKQKLENPLFRAEHEHNEAALGRRLRPVLEQLAREQRVHKDSFSLDKKLRDRFRKKRHQIEAQADEKESVRARLNLNLEILAPSRTDHESAKAEDFGTRRIIRDQRDKRSVLKQGSILASAETTQTKKRRQLAATVFKSGLPATTVTKPADSARRLVVVVKAKDGASAKGTGDCASPVESSTSANKNSAGKGLRLAYVSSDEDD